jgi:L-ascorbate metabolism protein UlaG (beta-lactamase superfamily)
MAKKTIAAVTALAAGAAWAAKDLPAGFGASPSTIRRDPRVRTSPQFRDGAFHNAEKTRVYVPDVEERHRLLELFTDTAQRKPSGPIPVVSAPPASAEPAEREADPGTLHITWFGHASALVEIDGVRVLIDPMWSDRCSPSRLAGPRRLHKPPIPLAELPPIDVVVISHDHYDHLDMATIRELAERHAAPFVVPIGVGAHLRHWHIPEDRIIELDWDERTTVGDLELIATPAQHFSGRRITKRNYTLWGSWVIAGPTRRVFYSGDTGYFDGFARIGTEHGPFDATLVQVGAYDPSWPDIHMTPEEGVAMHIDVRGGVLIPVHWGTFVLAFHPWGEPVDRLWDESKARGVTLAVPRPGERVNVDDPPAVDGWWQTL